MSNVIDLYDSIVYIWLIIQIITLDHLVIMHSWFVESLSVILNEIQQLHVNRIQTIV